MKRNPKAPHIWMPREQKTAAELIEESASVTVWLTLLMFVMGILIAWLAAAALRDNPPSQSAPITTTVEDYR